MTAYLLTDTNTMLRRSLRRMRRYPSLTFFIAGIPVAMLLPFAYVLGGALGAGLPSVGGDGDYLAFLVPGILLLTVASASQGTAISVSMDMQEGIIARFRTMAISRTSVLAGHVVGLQQIVVDVAITDMAERHDPYPGHGAIELGRAALDQVRDARHRDRDIVA